MALVSIDSAEENDFVRNHSGGVPRWIGANDLSKGDLDFLSGFGIDPACTSTGDAGEGHWFWAGAEASTTNSKAICNVVPADEEAGVASGCVAVDGAYQNWQPEQPDNLTLPLAPCLAGQDCGMMLANGTWDDANCSVTYAAFVCEAP